MTGPRRVAQYGNPGGHDGEIEVVRRRLVWTWKLLDGKAVSLRVSDVGEAREAG